MCMNVQECHHAPVSIQQHSCFLPVVKLRSTPWLLAFHLNLFRLFQVFKAISGKKTDEKTYFKLKGDLQPALLTWDSHNSL